MSRSLVVLPVLAAGLVAGIPGVASGQAPAPSPEITAIGRASVEPRPVDRRSEASIAKAVRDAQAASVPLALADGRARAQRLAAAAGLTLGALKTISDVPPSPFGPYGDGYGAEGTFGPGRYCGTVNRYRTRRLSGGRFRRVRIGSRRVCRVPRQITGTVSISFHTTPPA
jgi:hypothetical protein